MANSEQLTESTDYTLQIIESLINRFDVNYDQTQTDENAIKVGSRCEVYDNEDEQWCIGTITDTFIDVETNEEMVCFVYDDEEEEWQIPHHSKDLIIINNENEDGSMGVNILKQKQRGCKGTIKDCQCLKRIIYALKYYHNLNIINKQSDRDKLVELGMDIYQELLDDYIHIVLRHNDSLEEIFNFMIQSFNMKTCDLFGCSAATRHHRDRRKDHRKSSNDDDHQFDEEFMFFRDTMDGIHCYLHHLYDIGYRIKKEQIESDIDEKQKPANDKPTDFDVTLFKLKQIIKAKEKELKKWSGFNLNRQQNNKFTLNADNKALDEQQGIYIY